MRIVVTGAAGFAPSHFCEQLLHDGQRLPQAGAVRFRISSEPVQLGDRGECPGEIIPRERGENGFGYDRIFLVSAARQTMAELPFIEKNHLSHRAKAVKGIIPLVRENI